MMSMGLSMHQAVELRQTIRQQLSLAQRLELKQELKLALELIQKLIQKLQLGHLLKLEDVKGCLDAIHAIPLHEWRLFARHVPAAAARGLANVIDFGARFDPRFIENRDLAGLLRRKAEADDFRAQNLHLRQQHANAFAFQLIIRNPDWFGGCSGHSYNLAQLLKRCSQRAEDGSRIWILAGGWAVELLTRVHMREHHDIDTLMLVGDHLHVDTDAVLPENYFDVLKCSSLFISRHCVAHVEWTHRKKIFQVDVVRPEFLFCSKFVRPPRPKDWKDVILLVRTFAKTWDLNLITKIARQNRCGFTRVKELRKILESHDPKRIVDALRSFHSGESYEMPTSWVA